MPAPGLCVAHLGSKLASREVPGELAAARCWRWGWIGASWQCTWSTPASLQLPAWNTPPHLHPSQLSKQPANLTRATEGVLEPQPADWLGCAATWPGLRCLIKCSDICCGPARTTAASLCRETSLAARLALPAALPAKQPGYHNMQAARLPKYAGSQAATAWLRTPHPTRRAINTPHVTRQPQHMGGMAAGGNWDQMVPDHSAARSQHYAYRGTCWTAMMCLT
ncbi:hypothetical protein HaLaN_04297 [Haematococcus lacustris]|uniref:Uncharacterized protein n=1 Tax=Haematococcus lacustris TaxID=44745 RepID=A0A699YQL9_HAELA|nr:hypothetical protein HaLaN_04297 [Haematococcus lacustris]